MGRLTTNKPFDFGGQDHEQVPEIFDGILTTAESCQFSNNSAGSAALIIIIRVGKFYPHAVLTMVKTPVKTGLGKTPKNRMSWTKLGKTNFLNSRNASYFHILFINL